MLGIIDVLRVGRRFWDEKRITITTLQSLVNIHRGYSAGYFLPEQRSFDALSEAHKRATFQSLLARAFSRELVSTSGLVEEVVVA